MAETAYKNSSATFLAMIGVAASFTLANSQMAVTPALSLLAEKMPGVSYTAMTYLSTIPSLMGIPMSVLVGWLIKKGLKYKTTLLMAIAFIVIGGVVPYWLTNFTGWIIARLLFSVGFGCGIPISGSLTMLLFQGEDQSKAQGLGSIVQNLTGILLPLISGWICAVNVDYIWFVHFIFLIPFMLLFLFVPEPRSESTASIKEKIKEKVPSAVYFMSIVYGLVFMFIYPIILNMAAILSSENLGNTSLTGTMTATFFLGGTAAGVLFAKVNDTLGSKLIPLACMGSGIGMCFAFFSHNIPMLLAANFIVGICTMIIWPASLNKFGKFVPVSAMTMASSLFGFCINLFSFLASPYSAIVVRILGTNPRVHFIVGGIGCLIVGLIYYLFRDKAGS